MISPKEKNTCDGPFSMKSTEPPSQPTPKVDKTPRPNLGPFSTSQAKVEFREKKSTRSDESPERQLQTESVPPTPRKTPPGAFSAKPQESPVISCQHVLSNGQYCNSNDLLDGLFCSAHVRCHGVCTSPNKLGKSSIGRPCSFIGSSMVTNKFCRFHEYQRKDRNSDKILAYWTEQKIKVTKEYEDRILIINNEIAKAQKACDDKNQASENQAQQVSQEIKANTTDGDVSSVQEKIERSLLDGLKQSLASALERKVEEEKKLTDAIINYREIMSKKGRCPKVSNLDGYTCSSRCICNSTDTENYRNPLNRDEINELVMWINAQTIESDTKKDHYTDTSFFDERV